MRKSKQVIEVCLCHDFTFLSQWLICNMLSLYLSKTESILFGYKQRFKSRCKLDISCNGELIGSREEVIYLGATIDRRLSFESMAMSVIHSSNDRLTFLCMANKFLYVYTKKLLVSSLVQCNFDSASVAWFNGLT